MLVNPTDWARYSSIINKFHDSANQDTLEWYSQPSTRKKHGEEPSGELVKKTDLKVLFYYNYFRTWPITEYNIQGEVDKESCVALINIQWMRTQSLCDLRGRLIFDAPNDIFIHRGDKYEVSGNSFLSQAGNQPLFFMLILKRLEHVR